MTIQDLPARIFRAQFFRASSSGPSSSGQAVDARLRRTHIPGLHRGDLRICRDGPLANQYFSTLASGNGGVPPRIERGRNIAITVIWPILALGQ